MENSEAFDIIINRLKNGDEVEMEITDFIYFLPYAYENIENESLLMGQYEKQPDSVIIKLDEG